ncbi:NAD(P)/FAD-dependent oxidoreductase [Aerococcus viridans]|uniref:Ferredoxin--NADP reductase n=1 Tax=Aerococcus viridans TaxID=1377 RepID=A0A2N6UER9_9LACT|nr:NAD(P)/FAD-dependent oxidoreductase [Aerococcus viridans]PMC80091.1 NAD(P)/FAD-dependent oxidoreductase [Aerococcus viridans]
MTNNRTDLLIVGAGPVGMFTAFYAGMRNLSVRLVDSLPEIGGQPKALYPEKNIFDIPAYPKITSHELSQVLTMQLDRFRETTQIHLNEKVLTIQKIDQDFIIETSKRTYTAGAIIIAAGNGSFKPRKIAITGLDEYEDNYISYHVSNFDQYTGKEVAVLGGGDSAFDASLALADYAKKVYLIHRRDRFRAHEYSVSLAKQKDNIDFITPYVPEALIGQNKKLTGIQIAKARSQETKLLNVEHIFMTYGFVSSIDEIRNWGLEIENESIQVDHNLQTNIPGIYAVGDIANYPNKAKLIATGFGEAPHAVNQVAHYLFPDRRVAPLHSTSMFTD